MNINEIQKQMTADALIVFRNNHFLGQDVLDEENRISALTGFDGSAAKLIITPEKAFLFVDGRYEIQARQQVDSEIVTVIVEDGMQNFETWMKDNLGGAKIAYNSWQVSEAMLQAMKNDVSDAKFIPYAELTWTNTATAFEHPLEYTGEAAKDKIAKLAEQVRKDKVEAVLITASDSVSWLTNLRSDALPDTPIIRAMAMVTAEQELVLLSDNVDLPESYRSKQHSLQEIKNVIRVFAGKKIAADFDTTPAAIISMCRDLNITVVNRPDLCAILKSEKNQTELQGMVNAHIRDGAAMCKFLAWLDDNYAGKNEIDMVDKLLELRKEQTLFYSTSFETIAGSGANAAIIHYQPKRNACAEVAENSVLLVDSGGQYFDGTTDVTRTVAIGRPTADMVRKFTIVLKAHIALATQRFPKNTSGVKLDTICRSIMWKHELDYKHGTGHGVGCFLNVHEGPQRLGARGNDYPLKANMVVSIEPGYYEEGNYGIRIENLVYVTGSRNSDFLNFVPLTVVPIDYRLIDKYLLDKREIKWLNGYHNMVYRLISPHLNEKEREWLQRACSPL